MRKSYWLILTAVVLLIAAAAHGAAGFVIAALILFVPYAIGVRLHPRTRHGACNGTGIHRSPLFPWATRRCRGCVGGVQVRHGARWLGTDPVRSEHRTRTAAIARAREQRTWR